VATIDISHPEDSDVAMTYSECINTQRATKMMKQHYTTKTPRCPNNDLTTTTILVVVVVVDNTLCLTVRKIHDEGNYR